MNDRKIYASTAQKFWDEHLLKAKRKRLRYTEFVNLFGKKFSRGEYEAEELIAVRDVLQQEGKINVVFGNKNNRTEPSSIELLVENHNNYSKSILKELEEILPIKKRHYKLKDVILNRKDQIRYLIKLNQYLFNQDESDCCSVLKPLIPVKERSLEIFGDEKYIKGEILFGCLKLNEIGCKIVTPELLLNDTHGESNKPILILENYSSYWSFNKINSDKKIHQYSVICYGEGKFFHKQHFQIEQKITDIDNKEIFYLGDIDPDGILVPTKINEERHSEGLEIFKPGLHYYRLMLKYGVEQDNGAKKISLDRKKEAIAATQQWFAEDPNLADGIVDVINRDQRIPQECIGFRLLQQDGIFQ